jgi:hypothetical protein
VIDAGASSRSVIGRNLPVHFLHPSYHVGCRLATDGHTLDFAVPDDCVRQVDHDIGAWIDDSGYGRLRHFATLIPMPPS